jgi:membrane protease subunit HflC
LKGSVTRFLLKPDSDFFRYFGNPSGVPAAAPKP